MSAWLLKDVPPSRPMTSLVMVTTAGTHSVRVLLIKPTPPPPPQHTQKAYCVPGITYVVAFLKPILEVDHLSPSEEEERVQKYRAIKFQGWELVPGCWFPDYLALRRKEDCKTWRGDMAETRCLLCSCCGWWVSTQPTYMLLCGCTRCQKDSWVYPGPRDLVDARHTHDRDRSCGPRGQIETCTEQGGCLTGTAWL